MLASGESYDGELFRQLAQPAVTIERSRFEGCRFVSCNFAETQFSSCRFNDCLFEDCDLGLTGFQYCDMSLVELHGCKCIGVNWTTIEGMGLTTGAPFSFNDCQLNHSTFLGMKLEKLVIRGCTAHEVDFRECELISADFSNTDLSNSLFQKTDLSKANLSSAKNYAIAPQFNTITDAKFKLPEAMALLYALDIKLLD